MSSTPKIAKIKASIEGREVSPEGMRVTTAVNSVPVISTSVNAKSGSVIQRPASETTLSVIREAQKERLAGVKEPNIKLQAEDGNGGNISFSGFLTAPVVEISRHNVGNDLTILGEDGVLDSLDFSIYRLGAQSSRADTIAGEEFYFPTIPSAVGGDVPATLTAITDTLLRSVGSAITAEPDKLLKEVIRNQDEINNGKPIEAWRKVLANSDVRFEAWAEAFKLNKYYSRRVSEVMFRMLCEKSGGFWSTFNALMASFQMHYVPSLSGSGKLMRNDTKASKVEGSLDVSVIRMTLSDGSHRLLQPGGVVMLAPAAKSSRKDTSNSRFVVAAQYPDVLLPGYVQRENCPQWLTSPEGAPILGSDIGKKGGAAGGVNLSLSALQSRQETVYEYVEKVGAASSGIMTEMCKVMFEEMQLAHSTASITTNLDFTVPVGIRKTINVRGGGSFEGFIRAVTHTVDLREGKQLNSNTTIELSHVRY